MILSSELSRNDISRAIFHFTDEISKFPADVIGGSQQANEAPRLLTIWWNGEKIQTDIPTDDAGNVRAFFRRSRLTRKMYKARNAQPGDRVIVIRLSDYEYVIEVDRRA